MLGVLIFVSFVVTFSSHVAEAKTFFISPNGSDSANTGETSSSPWRTFAFTLPKLNPGDTLILSDGTYSANSTGDLFIDCAGNSKNGTATSRITLRAANERKALLQDSGVSNPLLLVNCSYWTLEGLTVQGGDFANATYSELVSLKESNGIIVRRFLIHRDNRYKNSALLFLRVNNSLFEENELYLYHRYGLQLASGSNNYFRRNFANSRSHADIVNGFPSANGETSRGDAGFNIYGSAKASFNVFENNISEGNGGGYYLNAYYQVIDQTYFYGNISLHDSQGFFVNSGPGAQNMTTNLLAEHNTIIEPRDIGALISSAKGTVFKNISLLFGQNSGLLVYKNSESPGDNIYSFSGENILSVGKKGTGINITADIQTWTIHSSDSFMNSTNYSPTSSSNFTNALSRDPAIGSCRVWIPVNSPLIGLGKNGANIGASILYRYEGGSLTKEPLWNPVTGQFPCGAVVSGMNDIVGNSCNDVHLRLNINSNACAFPPDYAASPGSTKPAAPKNLRVNN